MSMQKKKVQIRLQIERKIKNQKTKQHEQSKKEPEEKKVAHKTIDQKKEKHTTNGTM